MKIQIALLAAALLAGCSQQSTNAEEGAAAPTPPATATEAAPAAPAATDATDGTAADMGMTQADHDRMAGDARAMGMDAKAHAAMGMGDANTGAGAKGEAGVQAKGTGVVKSIDAAAGKVTLSHGPIASLNWPAMTMAFNASPQLLAGVKEGDRVHFEFTQHEGSSTLSMLQPRRSARSLRGRRPVQALRAPT